jgi:hypothetical protein
LEIHAAAVGDPVWSMPITSITEKIDRVDVAGTGRQNGLVAMAWTPIGRSLWVGDGSSIAFAAAASNLVLQRFPVLYLCRLLAWPA